MTAYLSHTVGREAAGNYVPCHSSKQRLVESAERLTVNENLERDFCKMCLFAKCFPLTVSWEKAGVFSDGNILLSSDCVI